MARVVYPNQKLGNTVSFLESYCQINNVVPFEDEYTDLINCETPFLVSSAGSYLELASAYLRERHWGRLTIFSLTHLSRNSISAFAHDLSYFLNTYSEPGPALIAKHSEDGMLLRRYNKHLEDTATALSASTIKRRSLVAREFITYVSNLSEEKLSEYDGADSKTRRVLISDSNQKISFFSTAVVPSSRRRHPSLISVLPPSKLLEFFESFEDPMLKTAAKTIYSTGLRRFELASIRAGQIAALRPSYPGGPAHLTVVGKGNKERRVPIEAALITLLKAVLVSKIRMQRLLGATAGMISSYADDAPFLVNRFGRALTGKAITEGFERASVRCGIKRTPHELRHEFATAYLLNAYRELKNSLQVSQVDAWLARLMIDQTDLAIVRLSQILGHSSPETTKRVYLVTLTHSEPSVRDAWYKHLDEMNVAEYEL